MGHKDFINAVHIFEKITKPIPGEKMLTVGGEKGVYRSYGVKNSKRVFVPDDGDPKFPKALSDKKSEKSKKKTVSKRGAKKAKAKEKEYTGYGKDVIDKLKDLSGEVDYFDGAGSKGSKTASKKLKRAKDMVAKYNKALDKAFDDDGGDSKDPHGTFMAKADRYKALIDKLIPKELGFKDRNRGSWGGSDSVTGRRSAKNKRKEDRKKSKAATKEFRASDEGKAWRKGEKEREDKRKAKQARKDNRVDISPNIKDNERAISSIKKNFKDKDTIDRHVKALEGANKKIAAAALRRKKFK
jgi:hypothetical protein